jgi:hypothetical protein
MKFNGNAFECRDCQLNRRKEAAPEAGKDKHAGFRLMHVSELTVKPISWLITNLIETDSFALIFGAPGTYKSFLAVAFACCVASGTDFNGNPSKQGTVIYIAGEGKNGLARRFAAWGIRNRVDLKTIPLFISSTPTGLCDDDQVNFAIETISSTAEKHGTPALIILDTVARNFGSGDENGTRDMSAFVSGCDKIRSNYADATVLLVHHSGLADKTRSRGSMALKAALDAEYRMETDETGVIRFESCKMKDADKPDPLAFRPCIVDLGLSEGNIPITSIILDPTSYEPPAQNGKAGKGKWQTVAIEVLRNLYEEHEERLESSGYENTARVSIEDWRVACTRKGDFTRSTWQRIKMSLSEQGKISLEHGFVYLC